ncbi:MAG TPA: flagellar motor protein MotA, partial [Bryobacteraceae bacterium]
MSFEPPAAFLLQMDMWELVSHNAMVIVVLGILACFSVFSWAVTISKWQSFRSARKSNARFLRAFRKAPGFEAVMVASEQFRPSPLVAVFDFGYEEVERQVKTHGKVNNRVAL